MRLIERWIPLDALISIAGAMAAQQARPCQIGLEQRDARFLG